MSSCDRRLVLAGLLALAACGYEPAATPNSPGGKVFSGQIEVAAPNDQIQYAFVQEAEARLGPTPRRPRYLLNYTITTDDVPIGTTPSQVVTRYNVIGKIDWNLTSTETGTIVTSGGFQSFSSYADSTTPVAGLSAKDDAYKRLMTLMADQVVDKLVATAPVWQGGGAATGVVPANGPLSPMTDPSAAAVSAMPVAEPHISEEPL